jgi:hypothetical protein
MSSQPDPERIARELRFLKAYAVGSSLVLLVLLVGAFAQVAQPRAQTEVQDLIRARRIEIVNADGRYALVLASRGMLPGPVFGGREYPQALSGGREQGTGMLFFNERGDEVGGLTYHGQRTGTGYRASGGIMFDQFEQDQVVGLQYSDNGARRSAGLNVWDRSPDVAIGDIIDMLDARSRATGAVRDSLDRVIRAVPGMEKTAHRIFLGSDNRTATLLLRDTDGRPRIRLYVDSTNVARLEFLSAAGEVVDAFPR